MSMQYTSAAVLRLIDRHKLTLETTIGNLLPNTPGAEKIMLRDLLLQQSGLDDINSHSDYGEILQHHQTPASLVAQIDGHSLSFASGSKHARSLLCYHARLVKVKKVSADVSERQALSSLIRCSSSREPMMIYDSLSTVVSRVDVGASLAGLEHCRDISLFPSGWERSENRLNRLLSCVGMSKLLE